MQKRKQPHPMKPNLMAALIILASLILTSGLLAVIHHQKQQLRQQQNEAREQAQAQALLQQTLADIQAKLPPPDSADLQEKMPTEINLYLQNGFRYYRDRDAYKYTFLQYQPVKNTESHSRNQTETISAQNHILNIIARQMPDSLKARTIWLRSNGKQWQCYATVEDVLRPTQCNDAAIVANLEADEEAIAYRAKGESEYKECGLVFSNYAKWSTPMADNERPPQIMLIENNGAEKVLIRLGSSDGSDYYEPVRLLLKNNSPKHTVWQIASGTGPSIHDIFLIGSGSAEIQGLQHQHSIQDYESTLHSCNLGRYQTYRREHWNILAEYVITLLPKQNLHRYTATPQHDTIQIGSGAVSLYPTSSYRDWDTQQLKMRFDPNLLPRGNFKCPNSKQLMSANLLTLCQQTNPTHPQ